MLMLYCLETYYEHSHDQRVIDLMGRYFKFQSSVPDDKFLTHYWQKMRGVTIFTVYTGFTTGLVTRLCCNWRTRFTGARPTGN